MQLSWVLAETKYHLNDGTIPDELNSFVFDEKGISKVLYENKNKERYIVEINSNGEARVVENLDIHGKDEFVATNHTITLSQGGTYQITSSSELTWNSSDSNIASITTEGAKVVISRVEEGNVVITGKNKNNITAVECQIRVTESSGGKYKWKKYNANTTNVYGISGPYEGTLEMLGKYNCNIYVHTRISYDKNNGYFVSCSGGYAINRSCLYACAGGSNFFSPRYIMSDVNNTGLSYNMYNNTHYSSSRIIYITGGQYAANNSYSYRKVNLIRLTSYLITSKGTKGTDTGEIVESDNPLLIIILILIISLSSSNKKISEYENTIETLETKIQEIDENYNEEENKGPVIRNLVGEDRKNGLYIQNAKIETNNGTSKLYVDIVNNTETEITNQSITICLTNANREIKEEYTQTVNNIKLGKPKTIEINIKKAEEIEKFYVK